MIETIAARLAIPLHTGFSPTIIQLPRRNSEGEKIGELHAETLSQDHLDNKSMFYPNPVQPGIYLMKIHGALDIFSFNDGRDLIKLLPLGSTAYGYVEALRAANEDLIYLHPDAPNGRAKAVNEITFADESGEMQFLRKSLLSGAYKFNARSRQVLPKSMLKHFQANLNFVTNLICIGYGHGDQHINGIIREWLEFTQDRRLEIVNPSIEEVPSFLLHVSPQVTLTKSDASDFFDQRSGTVRSWREKMEKRISASLRRRGQPRAALDMNVFASKKLENFKELLIKKFSELPHVSGRPDLAALGDPTEIADRWVAELNIDEAELLKALLDHLEET